MLLTNGTRLGPYEIVAALGAGGMGEVYRARDPRLNRFVAIKLLTGTVGPDARTQLQREARAAAALNHPHICTIHEIAEADDRLFIVMEHIDGRPLSGMIADGLPAATAARYGVQIADALSHAHERGVIHRDLKSANLMVTADGRVKVLDFGIATLAGEAAAGAATRMATAPGMVAGTLAYLAPEVLKGAPADRRSDIWALGVVLYEVVAGGRPFGGSTSFEVSSTILRDEPAPLPSRIPSPLRTIVTRCLAKDPALRYQQAGEVRAALEMVTTDAPAPATAGRRGRARTPRPRKTPSGGASRIRAIAVLPLDNLSRDPEQEYFADGMTDALIGAVARIEGLRVISRTSIMRYKGTQKSVPEIAHDLNVDGIIGGSVRRVGDRVRITAHLIDPQTDAYVWTANYDRDLHDVLALETEIGEAVASQIALKVAPTHRARASTRRRVDPETYSLYLKGRHSWNHLTEPALRLAIQWFEQAIERDDSYAPAYAGLADAYYFLGLFESLAPRDAHAHGAPAAQRALELDPTLADAHASVANFKFSYEWDWMGAEAEYKRAIELNPSASMTRWLYALYLGNLGRIDEAIKECGLARDLDPLWVSAHQSLAFYTFLAEQYDEAAAHNKAALDLDPNYPLALVTDGTLHLHFGRMDEAIASFRRAVSVTGGLSSFYSGWFGLGCAMCGRRDEAEAIVRDLEHRASTRYVSHAALCWVHAALGHVDDAVRCLQVAHQQHDSMFICLPTFFGWDPIRDTDAFRDIVARMNFPRPGRQAPTSAPIAQVAHALPATSTPVTAEKSIIVLPFANLSPDADDAYFSDGLTDELITDLSRVANLRVVPSAASFRLKKATKDLATIAREFNVGYVVEGRVRKAGQSIRITAQLVDVAEDRTIWADKYTGEFEHVFELQERVSRSIAGALQLRLQPASRAPKPEAAEALLKGRHFARQATSAGFQKALQCFQQATLLDPAYAPAFAALAEIYVNLTTGWDALPALETMPNALAAAERALEIDPALTEAHVVRALVAMFYEWDRESAEREFREALRVNPNDADAHKWYAALLIWLDPRYDEALGHIQRAITLDPVDPWIQVQAVWVHAFSRDFTRAVEQARQVVASDPFYGFGHYALGCALILVGQADEAIACFTRGIELDGRGSHHVALLGLAYGIAGQKSKAHKCLSELDALDRAGRNVATWKIYVYAGLGDADQVIRCLENAVAQRTSSTLFVLTNPHIDFVRSDPRFIALLQKMGLGYLTTRTWQPEWRPPTTSPPIQVPAKRDIGSLAVLPLENLSADPDQEYFADGMTEALIAELAQIGALRVISRSSAMRYKGTEKAVNIIARELSVDAVLEGSVRRVGDQVRVTLELIHAETDRHLWAKSYDRPVTNVLQLQREIASAVAEEIQVAVTPGEKARLTARVVVDPAAYDAYLRGRQAQSRWTEEGLTSSIECFERAIERDPRWAPAYASLAESFLLLGTFGVRPPREMAQAARRMAAKALQLDESLAEAHTTLAFVEAAFEWQWTHSDERLRHALTLNPGSTTARFYLALLQLAMGRSTDAIAEMERARQIDPLSPNINSTLGWLYAWSGRTTEAMDQLRHTLELEPGLAAAHMWLGETFRLRSMDDAAIAEHQKAVRLFGGPEMVVGLGHAYAVAGHGVDARTILEELTDLARRRYVTAYGIALIHAGLNDVERAFEWLARACEERSWWVMWLNVDPRLEPLRADPRFAQLLARTGLSASRRAEGVDPRIRSLAVLPLENLSNDAEQEYFADGMTEALITELAQIAGLRVISRTSVMRFKRATKPAPEIARELGVDAIVTGSVLRSGDDVRITSQLVHAPSDAVLWARSYERRLVEVMSLQRELASAIASEIRATTGGPPPAGSPAPRSVDAEAYTEYLKGRHRWHRLTESDVRKAMEHFQAALARDPAYAHAYGGLAMCHVGLGWMGAVIPHQTYPRGKTAATRALELDASLWEPHIALGYVAAVYDWDWAAAEREWRLAITRQPGDPDAHLFHSFYFTSRGRFDEAAAALTRAHELDPLSALVVANRGYAAFFARRFEKAMGHARESLDLDPSFVLGHWVSGVALAGLERYRESIVHLDEARRVWAAVPILGWLGYVCAHAGLEERARDLIATLHAMPSERVARSFEIARIHVGLGELDEAFVRMEQACDAHEAELTHLAVDPSLDAVRNDPRFETLLRRVGLDSVARS